MLYVKIKLFQGNLSMGDLRMNDMMEERKKVIKLIRNRYILSISIIVLMLLLSQIIV